MLIKRTNKDLVNSFIPALNQLAKERTSTKVAYNTVKTFKSANTTSENYWATRKSIYESRCIMENGKPKTELTPDKKQQYIFPSPEIKEETFKLIAELESTEVEFEIFPIKLSDIDNIEISPSALFSLGEFIIEPTEEPAMAVAKEAKA